MKILECDAAFRGYQRSKFLYNCCQNVARKKRKTHDVSWNNQKFKNQCLKRGVLSCHFVLRRPRFIFLRSVLDNTNMNKEHGAGGNGHNKLRHERDCKIPFD